MFAAGGDRKFFGPLITQMDLLAEASSLLLDGAPEGKVARIDELREQVSELEARLVADLRRSLITPIDPEDLVRLSTLMKRLVDGVARAASRHGFCACQPLPPELRQELEIVHQCSLALKCAFTSFRNSAIAGHCDQIVKLKARGGEIARGAREKLFASNLNPLTVIRLREVYDLTDVVLNRYSSASQTLKRIKLKNG